MIVVDASVWIAHVLAELPDEHADILATHEPVCPAHVDAEVGNGLLRTMRKRGNTVADARIAMDNIYWALDFERVQDTDVAKKAFDLVNNASYADALYLALAQEGRHTLLTLDAGMAEAARILDIPHVGP